MHVTIKRWEALSNSELYELMQVRQAIFVVEQFCPYQDADGKDPYCHHLMLHDDAHQLLAYARLVPPGVSYADHSSIGRILTTQAARGTGAGTVLMNTAITWCTEHYPTSIRIGAQLYLKGFYEKFGFRQMGEPYSEDAIAHIEMVRGK